MKVMVLGARGLLGAAIVFAFRREGVETISVSRKEFDPLRDGLDALRIDRAGFVVNAIGVTPRRPVQPSAVEAINVRFPHALAAHCRKLSRPLIHISTDAVFDNPGGATAAARDGGRRTESSRPDARDAYGISKAEGEPADCLVLRGSFIGPELLHGDGLLAWFLRAEKPVAGFTNLFWNGMTSIQFAECIRRILGQDLFVPGIRHLYGEDVTKCELLRKIGRVFAQGDAVVENEAAKPRDMRLGTEYPDFLTKLAIPGLEEQLREMRTLCDDSGGWRDVPELRDMRSL